MNLPGGPTKDEIMAVSLAKLALRPDDIFADIGCGTGRISVTAAAFVKKVYAIDLRPEAVTCTRHLAEEQGVDNIEISCENGVELLKRIPLLDTAFVGGSRDLASVLSLLAEKRVRTVVVNAVLLSTLSEAVAVMQQLSIFREAVQVMISRSYPLAGSVMFRPLDPVFIIVGGHPC
ncbi:MAG: methyltransferase domain-containing protein [Methanoregulaceae archaeon]|nr:methyltransferase domain-containing protein [Methanoregulaceae archaeon]